MTFKRKGGEKERVDGVGGIGEFKAGSKGHILITVSYLMASEKQTEAISSKVIQSKHAKYLLPCLDVVPFTLKK